MTTLKEYVKMSKQIKKYMDTNPCYNCANGKGCNPCVIEFIHKDDA